MSSNKTGFRQGRLGIGKDPIFPLDVNGHTRIDGDLILHGTIADSDGNPIAPEKSKVILIYQWFVC